MPVAPPEVVAPIRFDDVAAAALGRALLRVADVLDQAAGVEAGQYEATVTDWAGFTRRWFDHRHLLLVASLRDAAAVARLEAHLVSVAPTIP